MLPFLIVGCGGSGGATLQFLLDQVTADLALHGVSKVPDAWQFLHFDVPQRPDGVGSGMPPTVDSYRNGHYVGLAPTAGDYSGIANALTQQLASAGQLARLATWHGNPQAVQVPIALGAGQKRSVGRVVTLARLQKVQQGLDAVLSKLRAAGTREELLEVTRKVSPSTESMVGMPPVVLVVSSMAGGAGASMVLDVCRVLSQEPGIDPNATALFLFTPEAFDKLAPAARQGVPGNALAMMGELVATQLGSAADDDEALMQAAGLAQGRRGRSVPFARVFPIGAKIGNSGMPFGDGTPSQLYRGLGRGLASLMLSGEATQRWISFDLANGGAVSVDSSHFGWSANNDGLQWGSFGFAQLNMGRDRYSEYVAQRLARNAVLRLVAGHRQVGDTGTDQEQRDRVVNERRQTFEERLDLPLREAPLETWLSARFGQAAASAAGEIVRDHVERHLVVAPGTPGPQWLQYVQTLVSQNSASLNEAARRAAYAQVFAWYEAELPRVEQEVAVAASTFGLPVTVELVRRVEAAFGPMLNALGVLATVWRFDAAAADQQALARAAAVKGAIDGHSAVVEIVREAYQTSVYHAVLGAIVATLTEVLSAMRQELLEPLRSACSDTFQVLEAATGARSERGTVVQLQTDQFSEWPVDREQVPARFTHAQNEVLLIDAGLFEDLFAGHVVRTMDLPERPTSTTADAVALASREILLCDWPTTGPPPEDRLVEQRARWRPAALSREPGSDEPVGNRRGSYRLTASPRELLARARTWVERPQQPLQEFVSTSLRDYVSSPQSEAVRSERTRELSSKLRDVLELAQPLVSISPKLVQDLHGGYDAQVAYKFSEVPLAGLPVGDDVVAHLSGSTAHPASVDNLVSALTAGTTTTRIDVFGSYPPLAPLVFTSLLKPLAVGWAGAVAPGARPTFWSARRSRRLAGAVPMNERQRRALVAGWYTARQTGRLRLPGESPGLQSVQVWDPEHERWVSFPTPLIVPQAEINRSPNNYLPAVLMSYGLAAAQVTAADDLAPLRPYTVLRNYWDDSLEGIDTALDDNPEQLAATAHLRLALFEQTFPAGAPESVAAGFTGDADLDRKALTERLAKMREAVGRDYLPPSDDRATGGGKYSVVTRPQDLWAVPLFHEVAPDAFWATSQLVSLLDRAFAAADDEVLS